uniref:translation initiation factor IF-2-like n=1 Tax=Nyctereutes procyonoides TaxID=34880 RepID=UPI002443F312|nr:translation initiation factor IF-2-like [Nyctereutes procyonoides]
MPREGDTLSVAEQGTGPAPCPSNSCPAPAFHTSSRGCPSAPAARTGARHQVALLPREPHARPAGSAPAPAPAPAPAADAGRSCGRGGGGWAPRGRDLATAGVFREDAWRPAERTEDGRSNPWAPRPRGPGRPGRCAEPSLPQADLVRPGADLRMSVRPRSPLLLQDACGVCLSSVSNLRQGCLVSLCLFEPSRELCAVTTAQEPSVHRPPR